MKAYSFLNVVAAIVGPGAAFNLGVGAAAASEGITIAPTEDKNSMVIGAVGVLAAGWLVIRGRRDPLRGEWLLAALAVVGVIAGVAIFGEPLDAFEVWGAVLVMAGLSVNVFGERLRLPRLDAVG